MSSRVDIEIGKRIRMRRKQIGMTQKALGKACGITGVQISKYECGINSLSVAKLCDIAICLNVPEHTVVKGLNNASVIAADG